MTTRCSNCGSPIHFDGDSPVKCPFCEAENVAPPKEVMVAVPVPVAAEPAAALPAGVAERRCPHCRRRLVSVATNGVTLSGCGACGGIWVDNASARHVLADPETIFADLARRAAAGATGSRGKSETPTCAECPAILDRVVLHDLELDTCNDHGTWFDARELESLVHILRHEPVDAIKTVPCQACGAPIVDGRGNVTDRGILCESCWRTETRQLVALADGRNAETGRIALGGALLGVGAVMLGALRS